MSQPHGGAVIFPWCFRVQVSCCSNWSYRNNAGPALWGQDTPLLERPRSECPWLCAQEAWLTTLWHATILASTQRKSTHSIKLIRAFRHQSRSTSADRVRPDFVGSGRVRALRDGEWGQMRPILNVHSFIRPWIFLAPSHKKGGKHTWRCHGRRRDLAAR